MKKLLMTFAICLLAPIIMSAEFESTFQVGGLMTYGGTTKTAYMVGGEVPLSAEDSAGFSVSTRFGYFTVRNVWPEVEGEYLFTVIKQVLNKSSKGWNPYIAAKSGFLNITQSGDDNMKLSIGFELGVSLFTKKIELGFGTDMLPVDGEGDQTFSYLILNFNL